MADSDGTTTPPAGDADELDEGSLPDDAKRLLKHMGRTVRKELDSVLDERLRVEPSGGGQGAGGGSGDGQAAGDAGGGSGGATDAPGRSFAERLGF